MTAKEIESVELVVVNEPGVLGRVAGHIRHEGWNIKRLTVDEDENNAGLSTMEIDIEGTHTKLAQVMERILNLDCVIRISMICNGEKLVRSRPPKQPISMAVKESAVKVPSKKTGVFRILAINPGSQSTKFAVYDDETHVFSQTIRHDTALLARYGTNTNLRRVSGEVNRMGLSKK